VKAFLWPDQQWRLELLDHAVEAVRRLRPPVVCGDLYEALEVAGKRGSLAYVGTHSPLDESDSYYGLGVQVWPGWGEREIAADADFHGAWIGWLR
jgi:hypothetical protein